MKPHTRLSTRQLIHLEDNDHVGKNKPVLPLLLDVIATQVHVGPVPLPERKPLGRRHLVLYNKDSAMEPI
jgi:hypothetical protein